jgi:hypothetical protein
MGEAVLVLGVTLMLIGVASKLGDMYVVRGLAAAYARNTTAPDLRAFANQYISATSAYRHTIYLPDRI